MQDEEKTKEQLEIELVEIYSGVLLIRLNDKRDGSSIQQLAKIMSERLVELSPSVVVVEVAGLKNIEIEMAQHLTDIINTAQWLGTRVILTGVRPSIYRNLAHLDADLSGITTCSSLVAGLWTALDIIGS